MLAAIWGHAQVTTPSNSPFSGDYVGCDGGTTFPLEVRHNGNYPIQWYTDSLQRMQLYPNVSPVINGYPALPRNGSLVLSNLDAGFAPARVPFSRLHLIDVGGNTNANFIAAEVGFRSWMRNGVTFTGNSDQSYIGAKYGVNESGAQLADVTDMVLQWSNDVPGEYGPDRLRFLYTADRVVGSTHGSNSEEGLEAMRFTPIDTATINAGLGDFHRGNILDSVNVNEPTERLDILNGRLRIRELPTTASNDAVSKYMVVDNTGVVHWRNLPAAATPGCEWSSYLPTKHVRSGIGNPGTGGSCPDREWLYNIGDPNTLTAKLNLYQNSNERDLQTALNVRMVTNPANTLENYGIRCTVDPANNQSSIASHGIWSRLNDPSGSYGNGVYGTTTKANISPVTDMSGVRGKAVVGATGSAATVHGTFGETSISGPTTISRGASGLSNLAYYGTPIGESTGVRGDSKTFGSRVTNAFGGYFWSYMASGQIGSGYGVYGRSNNASGTLTNSYGVSGYASGGSFNAAIHGVTPDTVGDMWAGYFVGKVGISSNLHVAGNVYSTSDASLKTNIEDITNASALIGSLQPKTFDFIPQQHPHLLMPQGRQWGLLAQDLQEVIPDLVERVPVPAVYDSTGAMTAEATAHLAVNYNGLIPVLIAAMKEQNARIDHLEQTLAACCTNPDGGRMLDQGLGQPSELDGSLNGNEKLRIQPNPFNERTTVFYRVEQAGRAQLLANCADGKELRVLQEAILEAGSYQYEWNTADLAPGVYYVTLLLDGQPVVKTSLSRLSGKAVKVGR